MNRPQLITDLTFDEKNVLYLYDDATGEKVVPGYTLKGHPTIGVGRALDVNQLSPSESFTLLNSSIDTVAHALFTMYPWSLSLDDVRLNVLLNMAFNMGLRGLSGFVETLSLVKAGEYAKAAAAMRDSLWFKQTGKRAERLATEMETGVL